MDERTQVAIAGGGIGGLTAALALLRRGFKVIVCEQATELREVGAGLQLSPNGLRALYQLGLEKPLMRSASEPSGKEIRLWNSGRTWSLFDLGASSVKQYGYPYLMMYRPDLHAILAEAVLQLDQNAIWLGAKCVGFEQRKKDVAMQLADGRTVVADVLVGADGVHSTVRAQLMDADQPRFSGCLAWRGVIPMDQLPQALRRPVGTNWIGPGAHVIHYPLHAGKLMNFVGIVEKDDWCVESWTQKGTHEEMHADFPGWHDDVHTLIDRIQVPYKWALMIRDPLSRWTSDNVTLLGDAAHPTLPFLAQGAAMAIEDGYILARCLGNTPFEPKAALAGYEKARIKRTTHIVQQSTENGQRFHNRELADAEGAAAYVDREWAEGKIRQRYDWLFSYDVDRAPVE
ncbi:FAD-binding protein [Pusillimonas caeni]|uniref:FAD-dependent monooxygenase n=1 Tax=Pusillimonas caeni TaxID=1348472 RepID=UPI000E59D6D5|nr:FAD-dependent monooxygenase [Pusillimonas caeni]TFL14794.1 FAD-binding protein [Pusillimonas caeni]